MFPKEIQNIINLYYQSYFVYELNQDFLNKYHWNEKSNFGTWITGCRVNFCPIQSYVNSTTWKNRQSKFTCISFMDQKSRDYYVPARYFTTLIESDLSDSEKAKMLIKRVV